MTDMTKEHLLAFLAECGGKLNLTSVNEKAARELAAEGVLKITETRRKAAQMGVVIGHTITKAAA